MAHDPSEHVADHRLFEGLPVTKFQLLLVASAVIVALIYIPLSKRIATGDVPRGKFWNFFEGLLIYLRDEVVRPNVGHKDADRFTPFIWTLFLFILVNNLLGMIPFAGAATSDFSVTIVLALFAFLTIHVSAIKQNGFGKYVKSFVPHLETDSKFMNLFMTLLIVPMITIIEVLSAFIRGAVLAIRLFANIYAGHVALAVILMFAVQNPDVGGVSPVGSVAAILMGTALSVLELFVAFLQAFVFTLLTSIFIGMQLHPEH